MEIYRSVEKIATVEQTEKHSIFIGNVAPVGEEEQAISFIDQIKTQHKAANHNAYAYIVRNQNRKRYSDDREPAKTAGLPILTMLENKQLVNLVVVVTRYFGGTLLGTGGLVKAYQSTAQLAVEKAAIIEYKKAAEVLYIIPYDLYEQSIRLVEQAGGAAVDTIFAENITVNAEIPFETIEILSQSLSKLSKGKVQLAVLKEIWKK